MSGTNWSRWKNLIIIIALFMLLIEITGARRTYNLPYAGFWTDGQSNVVKVFPNSPAEKSGLQKDDLLIKSDGIDMKDIKTRSRRPILNIGDSRVFTIQRNGESMDITLTYARMPLKNQFLNFAGTFIGLCLVIFWLLPYLKIQTKNTLLLAIAGLGLGSNFWDVPAFSSLTLRIIRNAIWMAIIYWGLASLLHFMLSFPKPKKLLSKKNILILLYGIPCIVYLIFLAFNIFQPDATHFIRNFSRILSNGLISLYLVLTLMALIHSYIISSAEERQKYLLNLALGAFVIGILPVLILFIFNIFIPNLILPGSEFYFLLLVIIPAALALSVLKTESAN